MALQLKLASAQSREIETVLSWPRHQVGVIRQDVLSRFGRASADPEKPADLVSSGLMEAQGEWTDLGRNVGDLLLHESWQDGDEVQGLLHDHLDLMRGAVLDVGCSTGWTLRQIRHASRRVGIDIDEDALALGYRLAEAEGEPIEFSCESVHRLPFADGTFECVICRNMLTYTHQRRALNEMVRVLKRGGILFLRYENFGYDLRRLFRFSGAKAWCCHVRDLGFGILGFLTGWQPEPGTPLAPGRMFGSTRRIRQWLLEHQCHVVQKMQARECPRLLGRATQTSLLACKL